MTTNNATKMYELTEEEQTSLRSACMAPGTDADDVIYTFTSRGYTEELAQNFMEEETMREMEEGALADAQMEELQEEEYA